MPATVATPAERRNGWTGPVTRSMNSGQWSIASRRPLPSLSSAKSFVPKPLALVLPASQFQVLERNRRRLVGGGVYKVEVHGQNLVARAVEKSKRDQSVQRPDRLAH